MKTEIYSCPRCDIQSHDDNGNPNERMCPCPRGGCEAEHAADLHTISVIKPKGARSLGYDAREALDALSHWDKNEFKDGMSGHTLNGMRPMILTKKLLKLIENAEIKEYEGN